MCTVPAVLFKMKLDKCISVFSWFVLFTAIHKIELLVVEWIYLLQEF